jgi:hypothetical protein
MAKRWQKQTAKLNPNHNWQAKAGYQIFVADRGAVRLNFPQGWVVKPADDCIKFHDREPPDETCGLAVSYLRLPSGVDWSQLPLAELSRPAIAKDRRKLRNDGTIHRHPRTDVAIAWTESTFMDPKERRPAVAFLALVRGLNIQALLTFEVWAVDRERFFPVWEEVLHSVQVGLLIKDPTVGEVFH